MIYSTVILGSITNLYRRGYCVAKEYSIIHLSYQKKVDLTFPILLLTLIKNILFSFLISFQNVEIFVLLLFLLLL
jgi:hypothetical protein